MYPLVPLSFFTFVQGARHIQGARRVSISASQGHATDFNDTEENGSINSQPALEDAHHGGLCPEFPHGECVFQTEVEVSRGRYETLRCDGNRDLIQKLGLRTPIGLGVNGPWGALLMTGMKTIETRGRALKGNFIGLPLAMVDTRTHVALAAAMGLEVSDKVCILGQLTFKQSIPYEKADEQDTKAFDDAFELDPFSGKFGGHRVPCLLDKMKKVSGDETETMYGWVVELGTVQALRMSGDIAANMEHWRQHGRNPVDAWGLWSSSKTDMCFIPNGDRPNQADPLERIYIEGETPIADYKGAYYCIDRPAALDGLVCLGTLSTIWTRVEDAYSYQ